jgi:hypothetical protein
MVTATAEHIAPTLPAGADHVISIATAAAELGIKEATTRRYLRAGRLAHLEDGVSADSVQAYADRRAGNLGRIRFKPATAYRPASPIEAACLQYSGGIEMRRTADRTIRPARKVLDAIDDGIYGDWEVARVESGRETADLDEITRILAFFGLTVPMKPVADTLRITRA